jgi:hypothetical protein
MTTCLKAENGPVSLRKQFHCNAKMLRSESQPSFARCGSRSAHTLLDHAEGRTFSGLVISKAEPGKYKDWEGKKSVQIRTDALYVEWIGKGAQLYYWLTDRFHKLQVSD